MVAFNFKEGACFLFLLRERSLIRGRALIRAKALYEINKAIQSYTTLFFFLSAINFLFICMHRIPDIYGFNWLSNLDHTNRAKVPLSLVFI